MERKKKGRKENDVYHGISLAFGFICFIMYLGTLSLFRQFFKKVFIMRIFKYTKRNKVFGIISTHIFPS